MIDVKNDLDSLNRLVSKIQSGLDEVLSDKNMPQSLRNKNGVRLHGDIEKATQDIYRLTVLANDDDERAQIKTAKDHLFNLTRSVLQDIFGISPRKEALTGD